MGQRVLAGIKDVAIRVLNDGVVATRFLIEEEEEYDS